MMHGFGFGGMWFGWLFWIVLIVVIVWAVKSFVDSQNRNAASRDSNADALEILKKRFANGEIDEEEFQRRKQLLQ
ncbi:MAG: SHOCT domain-containing protein [candidate division KSB1 bacterium]|nr:SHOCT domain-containing protein [candidate division KSB1 bacterium]